jgi:hypothetical protein
MVVDNHQRDRGRSSTTGGRGQIRGAWRKLRTSPIGHSRRPPGEENKSRRAVNTFTAKIQRHQNTRWFLLPVITIDFLCHRQIIWPRRRGAEEQGWSWKEKLWGAENGGASWCGDGHSCAGVLMALTEHITKAKVTSNPYTSTTFYLSIHIMSTPFLGTSSSHQHHGTISVAHNHNSGTHPLPR